MGNTQTLANVAAVAVKLGIIPLLEQLGGHVRFHSYNPKKGVLALVQGFNSERSNAERSKDFDVISDFFPGKEYWTRHSVDECGIVIYIKLG